MQKRPRIRGGTSPVNGTASTISAAEADVEELRRQLLAVTQELDTYREETRVQTEQLVKTQELLEKSRDRYADLFDFAPLPYMVLDRWGVILEVNLPTATLLGSERSRVVGFPLRRFVHNDDRAVFLDHMRRCRAESSQVRSALRLLSGDAQAVPVELTTRRSLHADEAGYSYPTAIHDLTEREEAMGIRNHLLEQLMAAEEGERHRLSRELHDVLGQHITALILGLRALDGELTEKQHRTKVHALLAIADALGQDTHRLALNLRPTALDDLGLESALGGYIDDWSVRTGIRVDYHARIPAEARLTSQLETALYRVVQEALTNVAKHAAARHVNVMLKVGSSEASVIVEDDGCGLDPQYVYETAARNNRLGLLGMRERIQVSGGTLEIESALEKGTTLFVRVPLKEDRHEVRYDGSIARVPGG